MTVRAEPRLPVIAALATLATLALPAPASAGERVIPPSAGELVFPALQHGAPGWAITSARIERDVVWASFCAVARGGSADPTRCFTLRLSDPRRACAGAVAGPWCIAYPEGAPPDGVRAPLATALAVLPEASLWHDSDTTAPSPNSPPPPPLPVRQAPGHPAALGLGLVLAPLACGLLLGRLAARIRAGAAWPAALVAAPAVAAVLALPALRRVGAWDLLATALLLGLGLVAGAARARAAPLALALAAVLASLGALEIASRVLPAPAASFPRPEEARLLYPTAPASDACAPLYPALDASAFAQRTAGVRPGAPLVLHVGDSMVEGVGVPLEQAFPALLGKMQPGVDHVDAGFQSSSLDFELLVTRAWVGPLAPARVVLYVFGYNDLVELDRASPCCAAGPLLDDDARARCPTPGLPSARLDLLAMSPAPYPVRVATGASALARRITLGFSAVDSAIQGLREGRRLDAEGRVRRYARLLRALRDDLEARGIPLTVVYLPARAALEDASPETSGDYALRWRVLAMCRDLGVETLDPWEVLLEAVRREGGGKVFQPPPDVHFTAEGHRVLAEWLAPRVDAGVR